MRFEELSERLEEMKQAFKRDRGRAPRTVKELEKFLRERKARPGTRHLKSLRWIGI